VLRPTTDAADGRGREPEDVLANDPSLLTLMLVTTGAGLTMFYGGVKKRRLRWRTDPHLRRPHKRRRHG
jgi:hypothetical protein